MFKALLRAVLAFLNAHLVVFGLFLPKTKEKKGKIAILNNFKKYYKNLKMWIRAGGGGVQPMWIIFTFYNIIIKSANVDKGRGVKRLSTKFRIKRHVFFKTPPLQKTSTLRTDALKFEYILLVKNTIQFVYFMSLFFHPVGMNSMSFQPISVRESFLQERVNWLPSQKPK